MIKLFEQFNNEQEIKDICKKYDIRNYTINPDGSIDVDGDVYLSQKALYNIPIKFNKVNGDFRCTDNNITSLENCPNEVNGDFNCNNNNLTTLEGCPIRVGGMFDCSENKLTNLMGSPERVNGYFHCSNNELTSLKGIPMIIGGSLFLLENPIKIIDSSIEVGGDVINIRLTNFDDKIKSLSQEKLKILFEQGVDYDIFHKDGSINDSRLERLFKDFNI